MKKRMILVLLIVILFFWLVINGFFSPFNYLTAKQAIREGKFKKICVNEHPVYYAIEKAVGLKYGIEVINIEKSKKIKPIHYLGIKAYNRLMMEAFIDQKGKKLYNSYCQEIDSICRMYIVK